MGKQSSEPTANVDDETSNYPRFTTASAEYAHDVYRDAVEEADVEGFLANTDSFDSESRTWLFGQGTTTTEALVKAIGKIVSSVVDRFKPSPSQPGGSRTVVNTYRMSGNKVKDADGYTPYPNLVIRASGPSFEDPPPTGDSGTAVPIIGYSNVASFCVVKLDSDVGTAKHDVREMEKYAKFIFRQQPNRLYVRCLVITEKHARLLHFDRAGAQVTPLLDIHQEAATFVKLVAGLASVNEKLLGFDDSVQWTIVNGKKAQGTLTTKAPDGTVKAYPIIGLIPIPCQTYQGRGTVCWRVRDPDTYEELVVKDSWRPEDRPPEHEFLKLFENLPGVVHMVSYEQGRGETKDYRCASTVGKYPNRAAMRTLMKSYGKSIEFFTSALQLLCAIRDAIAGHQRLYEDSKILHRDISHNNILLGRKGAKDGYRGLLIDLDMAFRATDDEPTVKADYNVGTRIFQSLTVLVSYSCRAKAPTYDYLDDLESFFYVVVYLFLIHRPDGTRVPNEAEGPVIVAKWDDDHPSVAFHHKHGIFGSRDGLIALEVVERTWGPACTAFYQKLKSWMSNVRERKFDIVMRNDSWDEEESDDEEEEEEEGLETLEELLSHRDEHYSEVLSIFDEAIEALQASATSDDVSVSPTSLDETVNTVDHRTTGNDATVGPSVVSPPDAGSGESSPPSAPVEAESPGSPSTAPSSLEAPAPTTPPPAAPSAFAVYSNPSSPRLKRRSEDGVHPESPPSKGRRISKDPLVTIPPPS